MVPTTGAIPLRTLFPLQRPNHARLVASIAPSYEPHITPCRVLFPTCHFTSPARHYWPQTTRRRISVLSSPIFHVDTSARLTLSHNTAFTEYSYGVCAPPHLHPSCDPSAWRVCGPLAYPRARTWGPAIAILRRWWKAHVCRRSCKMVSTLYGLP